LQTPTGETSISKKEDALEEIMCQEAFAGFERMARHQLDKSIATRTAVDPDRLFDLDLDSLSEYYLDKNDILEMDSESDDEMIKNEPFQSFQVGPKDPPDDVYWGLRLGYGFAPGRTPQDRCFGSQCGRFTLLGVVNCHGSLKIGTLLAEFVSQEMPRAFFKSRWLTEERDIVMALTHAFDRVHRKAIREIDCRLSGACVTVLLVDDDHIFVAHVGDCRAVLAVPDPNINAEKYHFIPVPLTEDHKLSVRSEFDRVLECGGEVRRLVNDNVHRLFFKEDYIPALTLTRGIGHRMAHTTGVLHFPTIQAIAKSDLHKDSFIILGSGGIWHAMSERGAVNWISSHFHSPGHACESIAQECKRRYEDPNRRLKAFFHKDAIESFACLLVYPHFLPETQDSAMVGPRPFVMGPHDEVVARREWKEVKTIDWKKALGTIMSGKEPDFLKEPHE